MGKKRDRYKIYSADNSVEVPKVSLWRMRQVYDTGSSDPTPQTERAKPAADCGMARMDIDEFHEEAMKSAFPDHIEDPTLADHMPSNQGEYENEDFEDDFDESQNADIEEDYSSDANQPLYTGAKITLAASMILLVSYAMKHALTGDALADLLVLVEMHCLTPNLCVTNFKTFKSFFRNLKSPLQFHHYCEQCHSYHGEVKQNICPNCHHRNKKNSNAYFLVIPIISQLSSLFADGTLPQEILKWKKKHQSQDNGEIADIMDGQLYKERFNKDGFFQGSTKDERELHISFQMNTDGVSLFHSSSFSIWPVYLIINELPPHLRFSRSYRIFAGLWFGYSKPDFGTFLKPFAESLHEIYRSDDSRGSKANLLEIKNELQRHLKKEKITIHHARGILVGCAEAGKTTLLKRLLGQTQDEVEDVESTRGLEVHQHLFHIRNGHLEVIGDDNTQSAFLRVQASDLKQSPKEEVEDRDKSKSEETKEEKATLEDTSEEDSKLEDIKLVDMKEKKSELEETKKDTSELEETKEEKSKSSITMKDEHILKILSERENFPTVSILDFAGQLAYYACHQIYITPKAFFILVLDLTQSFEDVVGAEKDNQEESIFSVWKYKDYLKFWINSIKTFGSTGAPLFVVATHTEDKSDREIEDYMEKFCELVPVEDKDWFFESLDDREYALGLLELNEKSQETLESIKNSIAKVLSEKINTKIEVRSSWALLEQLISDEGKKVLSLEEISEINKSLPHEYQLQNRTEISEFLKCFHDNGLCLYFEDERSREHVIWDTKWFAGAFSKLIADKNHITKDCKRKNIKEWKPFNKTGELKEKLVDALWKDKPSYGKYKSEIVLYMERLLMIVAISSAGATSESEMSWYIPCMNKRVFEKAIFEKDWEYSSVLCFRFTSFAMFVFYRLIAYCMGPLKWRVCSDGEDSKALYQTAGVFDYKNHTVVLCINDNDIQVQMMRVKSSRIEVEVSHNVGESIESAIQELAQTFNEQKVFEKGYKCHKLVCNEEDRSFIPAGELSQIMAEVAQCPSCPISKKHDINVQEIMGFWEKRIAETLMTGEDVEDMQTSLLIGEPHRNMFDTSYAYCDGDAIFKNDLCERIGCIECLPKTGTGFRVGSKYVITAFHVMEDILVNFWKVVYQRLTEDEKQHINWANDLPPAGSWSFTNLISTMDPSRQGLLERIGKDMITESSKIYFGFIKEKPQSFLKFSYDIPFACPDHDVVILELMEPQTEPQNISNPLLLTDINIPGGKLHVIGHPNGIKLQHDPGCRVISDQKDLTELVQKGVNFFACQGLDRNQIQRGYSPCVLSVDRILFHCSKSTAHGASGSPLIVIKDTGNEKTALVTGMLLRGHPALYYNYSKDLEVPPEILIETGISMEKVLSLLQEHSLHQLANELFSHN